MKTVSIPSLVLLLSLVMYSLSFEHFSSEAPSDFQLSPLNSPTGSDVPTFISQGIDYLVSVQFENGGWGAGSHSHQGQRDATQVQVDPATTAFAALALIRAGNTLQEGPYQKNLRNALIHLLDLVERSPEEGFRITDISGTQPQVKLGQNIDVSMCVQFFIRVMPQAAGDATLKERIAQATQKCLSKIQASQSEDGSINGGGWAPVLQSAMATNALELADVNGLKVDKKALDRARGYQKQNISADGKVRSERGAGVALYSVAGNYRATAQEARKAQVIIEQAKEEGRLDEDAEINAKNLKEATTLSNEEAEVLAEAYQQNVSTGEKMKDDTILTGFGNNGGEEFLSFMLTSESLVITGGEAWENWQKKMNTMLEKIQNEDGSWNGHHCITSPVFCTAACILALTAENDRDLLVESQTSERK